MRTCLLLCLLATAGCFYRTKHYAPPPAPAKTAPDVSYSSEPVEGMSRVVIDVAEGPALVEAVDGASISGNGVVGTTTAAFTGSLEYSKRICVTPCVVDTAPGAHELKFTLVADPTRTSRGFINADRDLSIYRHSIGLQRSARWKGFVGVPLALAGLVLGLGGFNAMNTEYYNERTDSYQARRDGGMIVLTGIGVGLAALGGWLIYGSVVEDQPGSGVQWHPQYTQAHR